MIFENGKFKGFIDFDLTQVNIRIFDNLVKGYESITPLSAYEKQALPYVIYSIQIICIAYFSKFYKFENLTKINIDMLKWLAENI